MKICGLLILTLAAWTAIEGGGPQPQQQPAPDGPLLPLVAIAKDLDSGFTRWLTGMPAAEAFRPFLATPVTSSDQADLRASLSRDRVTRVRSASTEFELVLRRDGRSLLYLRTGIALDARPSFTNLEARTISSGAPLYVTAYPLQRYAGTGAAFARAAANIVAILSSGNCSTVPLADRVGLVSGLPAEVRQEVEAQLLSAQRELPVLCARVNSLDPDEAQLRLDDVAHVALTADGRATGVIRSQFGLASNGALQFSVQGYRPFAR